MNRFDDETLTAYADGELDEATSAAVEAALAADPVLAERIAAVAQARRTVRELYAPLADAPVPEVLRARVAAAIAGATSAPPDTVVDLAARRGARAGGPIAWQLALAASLAAIIAGPVGWFIRGEPNPAADIAFSSSMPPAVARALDTVPSGGETTFGVERMRAIATFRNADGQLCREFELDRADAMVAVACRSDAEWRLAFAVEAPLADGYAPASSLAALDAWMEAVSAGAPLAIEDEARALAEEVGPSRE